MLKYLVMIAGFLPGVALSASFPVLGTGQASCESLWVERNQISNAAGKCFLSVLGQTVFDNGDCVPGEPSLSETALDRISQLSRAEDRLNCAIRTDSDRVSINGRYGKLHFGRGGIIMGRWPEALQNLDVFPRAVKRVRTCTVSGLSSSGDSALALRTGPDVRYPQIGQLIEGSQISSTSACMGRWCYADTVLIGRRQEPLNGWFHVNWCQG